MRSRLRVVLVCAALQMGVLSGVPMRPDEIRELMKQMNQPKMAHVLPGENGEGDDPRDSLLEH
jgi:hypothetical protein